MFRTLLLAAVAAALLAVPALAAESARATTRPTSTCRNRAGLGPIHAFIPVIVSIRGRGHGGERYDLCITPAPVEHAACYPNRRVNGPGVSTAFSKAGKAKLHWKLSSGKVITRTVRVKN